MTKRELFEARVHAMACAYVAADQNGNLKWSSIAEFSVEAVLRVNAALAEIPHAEEPATAPLAWRPMSEISQAKNAVAIAWKGNGPSCYHRPPTYVDESGALGFIELPLLPTVKL